jgi:hypothetical protein
VRKPRSLHFEEELPRNGEGFEPVDWMIFKGQSNKDNI